MRTVGVVAFVFKLFAEGTESGNELLHVLIVNFDDHVDKIMVRARNKSFPRRDESFVDAPFVHE